MSSIESQFYLYRAGRTCPTASIFNLIDGQRETKQTKGLAYLLAHYPELAISLAKIPAVHDAIRSQTNGTFKASRVTRVEVDAELMGDVSTAGGRIDIVVRFFQGTIAVVGLVIEAKSINAAPNPEALEQQLRQYLSVGLFPALNELPLVGITLGPHRLLSSEVVSLTWPDLVDVLMAFERRHKARMVSEYVEFITGIGARMRFYEREVLSIPAGKSKSLVERFHIYECPDKSSYKHRKTLFVTFRAGKGGEMDRLYKIEQTLIFNPAKSTDLARLDSADLDAPIKDRIRQFIQAQGYPADLDHNKRFYVLSERETIQLGHKPRPPRNNANIAYYTLAALLNSAEPIVLPFEA